jgi:hypothetical protein
VTPESAPSIFGSEFDVAPDGETPVADTDMSWLDDEAAEEAPGGGQPTPAKTQPEGQEGQQPSSPQVVAPEAGQTPAQGDPGQTAEGQTPDEAPSQDTLIGGRFKDVDTLLKSYNDLRKEYNQTLSREREAARRLQEAQLQVQQPQAAQGLTPEEAQMLLNNPQALEQYLNAQVERKVETKVQGLQNEQLREHLTAVAEQFMTAHPEVTPNSPLDEAMGEVINFFQKDDKTGELVYEWFPVTRENLEYAYEMGKDPSLFQAVKELDMIPNERNLSIAKEAVADPAFRKALKANLTALEDETGEALDYVRRVSKIPGLYEDAVAAAQPPSPEQVRMAAHVETGGTGAPIQTAPGQRPQRDELDEDIELWEKSSDNVFGLIPINN